MQKLNSILLAYWLPYWLIVYHPTRILPWQLANLVWHIVTAVASQTLYSKVVTNILKPNYKSV